MNAAQRKIIIERDGRECVICREDGERCKGSSEKCNVPSPTLNTVTYYKLDANRPAFARLQVDHILSRGGGVEVAEAWHHLATLCECHHRRKDKAMKERELAYAAIFEGKETEEYLAELAQEAIDAKKRKTSKARSRKRQYEHTKKKAGGSPLSKQKGKNPMSGKKKPKPQGGKLPQKVLDQQSRTVYNGNH